jgi:predicted permease
MGIVEVLIQDIRYALRLLGRSPVFTAVAVLSLALGIGANAAIFSVINAVMLRELPVRNPKELVQILTTVPGDPRTSHFWWKFYEHYRDQNHVFSDLIGMSPARFQVTEDTGDAETVDAAYVVGPFFPALGIRPAIGRLIGAEDDRLSAGDPAVAVLSWSFWQSRFNLSPSILNQRIMLNGVPATVIGVAPREFVGLQAGQAPKIWVPAAMEPLVQQPSQRANGTLGLALIGRLKPGVLIDQAEAEMKVLDQVRVEELATSSGNPLWRQSLLEVEPASTGFSLLRDQFNRPLLVLMTIVATILLITCTNLAGLLLARAAARRREMATRVALGAGRLRLVRQLLTESLLLSGMGGLLGVLLAYFGADALVRSWPFDLRLRVLDPANFQVRVDASVLLFTAGVAVVAGILFGLAPARSAMTCAPSTTLREGGSAGDTRSRQFFGRGLVVAQVALAVVLLSVAGLFVRHLSNLRDVNLGFERDGVLLVTLDTSRIGNSRDRLTALYPELLARLSSIPGVRSATLSAITPIQGPGANRFVNVDGFQEAPDARRYVSINWVAPKFFETLGTPRLTGRDFQIEDEGRPRVAIVNQSFARYYFGDSPALGRRFQFDRQQESYEIVGVAGDAKYSTLHEPAPRTVYLHALQEGSGRFSQFALRTEVASTAVAGAVRSAVRDVLKTVPIARITTLADQVDASIPLERMLANLSGAFAALGALLSALGLYGLLVFTVARRRKEIGIRMTLGATRRDVIHLVVARAVGLVSAGLIIGAVMALWSGRLAASLIANLPIDSSSPVVFAAIGLLLVTLLAAYLPARRAARIDPVEALRQE